MAPMQAEEERGRFRDALQSRDFRRLATSFAIDNLCSWAYTTVLIVYIFERTGSPTWIALQAAARWVPGLFLISYAGVLADRYERTRLMVASALASFVVTIGIAFVVAYDAPLWTLLALSALSAAASAPYRPAAGALTPEVVAERDLTAANGLLEAMENLVVVVGPAVGAIFLAFDEPVLAIALNAASFLVAACLVGTLRVRSRGDANAEEGESTFKAFIDGVRTLRSNRVTTMLVLFCALDSGIYGASTILHVGISEQLGTGADGYGYLLAGTALGGVLTASTANRLSASRRLAPLILGGITCQALPFALTAFVEQPPLGFVLMMVSGAGMIVVDLLAITAVQRDTPRNVLGRVLSLFDVAVLLSILISSFLFAFLVEAIDLKPTLYVLGFGFPAVALLSIRPMMRSDRQSAAFLREVEPRVAVLQDLDLFAKANRPMLERLAGAIEVVELPGGTDVVREGEPADSLWILTRGTADVTFAGDRIRTIVHPQYFGEVGVLHGIPRTATVTTNEPCVLWKLSAEEFLEAVQVGTASIGLLATTFSRLASVNPRLAAELPAEGKA